MTLQQRIASTPTLELRGWLDTIVPLIGTEQEHIVEEEYEMILDELDRRYEERQRPNVIGG